MSNDLTRPLTSSVELSVYGSTNNVASNDAPAAVAAVNKKRCTSKCKKLTALAVGVLLLLGGLGTGLYFGVKDRCKTVTCFDERSGCQCLTEEVYQKYQNGTFACTPCPKPEPRP